MLELIGRYQVQEKIGEGAMADVYRAYDPSIRRALAIKVMKSQYSREPEYASRFLREAKAAGALSHPHIATIYDVGEISAQPYIVMELLEGKPLSEHMSEKGRLPHDQVLKIAIQLADALNYAHGLGVIHRDIKPSNIMLLPASDSIKLVDFGIARVNEADGVFDADHLKTQVGQVLGTPRYMSPEQALGKPIDGRSDLFSLGVVIYEMITGKKAFGGASAATLALQITQEDPEPIAKVAPETPRGLQFIVAKLLSKRPERRFATGAQVADALRREQGVLDAVIADGSDHRRLPLQARVALVMTLVTGMVLAATVLFVIGKQDDVSKGLALTSGAAMTNFIAENMAFKAVDNATLPPEKQDWLPLQAFVTAAAADKNVIGITVADTNGIVRGSSKPETIGSTYSAPEHETKESGGGLQSITRFEHDGKVGFRFVQPILYAGRQVGTVDMSVTRSGLEAASRLTRVLMLSLSIVVILVVGAAAWVGANAFARPLLRLKNGLNDAAVGDLNFRISHNRTDEFGQLFDAFNRLTAAMEDRLNNVEVIALETSSPAVSQPNLQRRFEPEPRPDDASSPFAAPTEPAASVPAASPAVEDGPQGGPSGASEPGVSVRPDLDEAPASPAPIPPQSSEMNDKTVIEISRDSSHNA